MFAFTSVTFPSSTSGSWSISSNILSAPARAIITEFNCCEICIIGWLKLLDNCKNDASAPTVRLTLPFMANAPPIIATNAYSMFPRLLSAGINIFAYLFAFVILSHSSSFILSNPSFDFSS